MLRQSLTLPIMKIRFARCAIVSISDPDNARAEFAIVVKSDLKSRGLGRLLMEKIIRYCRERGIGKLAGEVLAGNERMLSLARKLGFTARRVPDGNAVAVELDLRADLVS